MKKLMKLKCTSCGANLSIEEKREFLFCQYCGAKLILDNENEYIDRHIDEADVIRAETEQLVKLKELEIAQKKHEENKKIVQFMVIITLLGVLIGIICFIIASNSGDDEHWGYMVSLLSMVCIPCMWIGKSIHDEDKNKK